MRLMDTGAGRIKAILSILFLIIVIFVGVKVIPVYVNDYELDDYVRQQTPFWLTQRASPDAILKNVLDKAQDLGLPVTADNVKVRAPGSLVNVTLDYTVPVDLLVATLPLHFSHSSENRQI
jgi:uncharacterized protein (UPF0333 family)